MSVAANGDVRILRAGLQLLPHLLHLALQRRSVRIRLLLTRQRIALPLLDLLLERTHLVVERFVL